MHFQNPENKYRYIAAKWWHNSLNSHILLILNDILRNGVFKLFTKYFIHFIAVQYIPLIFQLIKNKFQNYAHMTRAAYVRQIKCIIIIRYMYLQWKTNRTCLVLPGLKMKSLFRSCSRKKYFVKSSSEIKPDI